MFNINKKRLRKNKSKKLRKLLVIYRKYLKRILFPFLEVVGRLLRTTLIIGILGLPLYLPLYLEIRPEFSKCFSTKEKSKKTLSCLREEGYYLKENIPAQKMEILLSDIDSLSPEAKQTRLIEIEEEAKKIEIKARKILIRHYLLASFLTTLMINILVVVIYLIWRLGSNLKIKTRVSKY